MGNKEQYDLFISYRRDKGSTLAKEIQQAFSQKYKVFYDREEITAGSFLEVISQGITNSSVVISLLSLSSVERMLESLESEGNIHDVVVDELEQTRTLTKAVVFVFFQEWTKEEFIDPFQLLNQEKYQKHLLFRWMSSLQINLFYPMDDFGKQLDIVERVMVSERESKQEQEEERRRLTRKHDLPFQETTVEYVGDHYSWQDEIIPLGKGQLTQNFSRSESRVFHGSWWGSSFFSGKGELLVTRVLKAPVKLYQGAWHQLQFHDQDGWLEDKGITYEGGFYHGKKQFFGIEEGKHQSYSGIFREDAPVYGVTVHHEPSLHQPMYQVGYYNFYENGSILLLGSQDFAQCFVQTESEEYRFTGKVTRHQGQMYFSTVEEVAVRDLNSPEFQVILWGNFHLKETFVGNGNFVWEDEQVSFSFSGEFQEYYEKQGNFTFPDGSSIFVDRHEALLHTGDTAPKNKNNQGYLELILRCFYGEYQLLSCLFEKMPFLSSSEGFELYHKNQGTLFRGKLTVQDMYYLRGRMPDYGNCPFLVNILGE